MTTGRLGAADLSATTNTTIYTVPSNTVGSLSINVCNRASSSSTVRLALAALDTPATTEWIEYDASIGGNGVLERTGIVLGAGKKVVAYSSAANVSVVVWGYEESA